MSETDKTVTGIASFGADVSDAATAGLIVAEIDDTMHLDADGQPQTVFLPGESIYFLLHYGATIQLVRVRDTDGGDIQRIGAVTRTRTQQITFEHPAHLVPLPHQPSGQPRADKWYGRSSNLHLDGLELSADLAPCLGDISYEIAAVQYCHKPLAGLTLAPGEEFPVDIVIEYQESGD